MSYFAACPLYVGKRVKGVSGKRVVVGTVEPDPRNPRRPYIRRVCSGAVLCVVRTDNGRKRWINQIQPA